MWLDNVKQVVGNDLAVNWRYFSLEQINSKEGPNWKIWEQPEEFPSRTRLAFRAASAARQQGSAAFERFHMALLRLRHEERCEVAQVDTLLEAARQAGLDLAQFQSGLSNPALDAELARDHTTAVEQYGVFGTPTFVFANGHAAYLKMRPTAPSDQVMEMWETFKRVVAERPYVEEIKRPSPPRK